MKENKTLIVTLVDSSGSMITLRDETIKGINKIIEENKSEPGECIFSLYSFATYLTTMKDFMDIKEVDYVTGKDYSPAGGTALYDALALTIDSIGAKLAAMNEEDRPSKVLFMIITDGEENASKQYKSMDVKTRIEHQNTKYAWQFTYLGANQDAILTSRYLGINPASAATYTVSNTSDAFLSFAGKSKMYRSFSKIPTYDTVERENLTK